jgi:two-component system response regulator MprA
MNPVRPAAQFWTTGSFHAGSGSDDVAGGPRSGVTERPVSGRVRAADRLRVLVVEPAAVLRNIMAHALTVQGYEVRAVEGLAGLEPCIAVFEPHLVVTEVSLADGSGAEVCRLLQAQGGRLVPVILMSGMPEAELQARARQAGADRSFCKARGLSQLLDLVEELTGEIVY